MTITNKNMANIMSFQEAIQFLVSGIHPICTIEDIAAAMSVAPATVYGYKNQGTEPKFSQVVALNKWLISEHNCYVIERIFRETTTTRVDGKVKDDLWRIHELSTDAARHYKKAKSGSRQDKQSYFDVIQKIKEEVASLESEGNSL